MQITSSLMKFQKCKCSYKLIEIEINWFSLGIIDLYQLPAASCYLRNGLCTITQTLHKQGSFMSSEISSGCRLGALLFSTPLGCPASRKGLQPPAAQGCRREAGFSAGLAAELAMTDPHRWASKEMRRSYTTKLFPVYGKRPTAPCLKVTQEGLFTMVRCSRIVWYGRYELTC